MGQSNRRALRLRQFELLPIEILSHIMSFLDSKQILTCCERVSTRFQHAVQHVDLSLKIHRSSLSTCSVMPRLTPSTEFLNQQPTPLHLPHLSSSLSTATTVNNKQGIFNFTNHERMKQVVELDFSRTNLTCSQIQFITCSPNIKKLRKLLLCNNNCKDIQFITASEHFLPLQYLDLKSNSIGNNGAKLIFTSQTLQSLTYLDLSMNHLNDEIANSLGTSVHAVKHLKTLSLAQNSIGVDVARAISMNEHLKNLTHLNLGGNCDIGPMGTKLLCECQHLQQLIELNLHNCYIGKRGVESISSSSFLKNLESLNIFHNSLSNEDVQPLATSKNFTRLKKLYLDYNDMNSEGLNAVFLNPRETFNNLWKLSLDGVTIDSESVQKIEQFEHLKTLDVYGFNSEQVAHLLALKILPRLLKLNIYWSMYGHDCIKALIFSIHYTKCHLTSLRFDNSNIADEGVKLIAKCQAFSHLKRLRLNNNGITNTGAKYISKSRFLKNLTFLSLKRNDIGIQGLTLMIQSKRLKHLQILKAKDNSVEDHELVSLKHLHGSKLVC